MNPAIRSHSLVSANTVDHRCNPVSGITARTSPDVASLRCPNHRIIPCPLYALLTLATWRRTLPRAQTGQRCGGTLTDASETVLGVAVGMASPALCTLWSFQVDDDHVFPVPPHRFPLAGVVRIGTSRFLGHLAIVRNASGDLAPIVRVVL